LIVKEFPFLSFPLTPALSPICGGEGKGEGINWIPAFAGMTKMRRKGLFRNPPIMEYWNDGIVGLGREL